MAASEQNHSHISRLLSDAGLEVVMQEVAGEDFIRQLEQTTADVLLVDLCDDAGSEVDIIDTLLEYDTLPVLFNDSSKDGSETDALWAKKLARRLEQMVRDHQPAVVEESTLSLDDNLQPAEDTISSLDLELLADEQTDEQIKEHPEEERSESTLEVEPEFDLDFGTVTGDQDIAEYSEETDSAAELELESAIALDAGFEKQDESELEFVAEFAETASLESGTDSVMSTDDVNRFEKEISGKPGSLPQPGDSGQIAVKEHSSYTDLPDGAAVNVWVLGASLGGPQAVRQFLIAIREDLPVAFILAQHIGENHISLLAEQLDRISQFKVFPGYNGHMIRHHEVILAPAGKNLKITDDGYISLSDQEDNAIYSPCINDVMTTVAKRYGNLAGTIVFSGMGDDGAIGCQSVAENGGIVWAQDVDSCVISSMPDQARKTNNVTFSANPRRLADELYKYYME